ncbi:MULTISPECIES: hypothetical protein [unclassified Sphingomonas]|uniref:hypothetical protein n=1 Tax=unclassified Sphingomonas TaxID=196159 RepID=UPI0022698FFC|nr:MULTISPECIES: hypothetical protein [unclassified Sphingomonas]
MPQTYLCTLDLLNRALSLMDAAGVPLVAAQISAAIESVEAELAGQALPRLF